MYRNVGNDIAKATWVALLFIENYIKIRSIDYIKIYTIDLQFILKTWYIM